MSNSLSLTERLTLVNTASSDQTPSLPGSNSSRERSESPPAGITPQVTSLTTATRKRRSDNEIAYDAAHVSQKLKLSIKDKATLTSCAKMSDEQRELYNIGLQLKVLNKLNVIQPAEALFVIGAVLNSKIEVYTSSAILCPTTRGYKADALRVVMNILSQHPGWGLTREVKNNECHYKVVHSRVASRLTEKRRETKSIIAASFGTHNGSFNPEIVSQDIISLVKSIGKVKGDTVAFTEKVAVTLQMLGRVAFLRQVHVECEQAKTLKDYWKVVDKKLQEIRDMYAGKSNARTMESQFFKGVLDSDLATYGQNLTLDLDDLDSSNMSQAQRVTEDAVAGHVTVLTDDEDEDENANATAEGVEDK